MFGPEDERPPSDTRPRGSRVGRLQLGAVTAAAAGRPLVLDGGASVLPPSSRRERGFGRSRLNWAD